MAYGHTQVGDNYPLSIVLQSAETILLDQDWVSFCLRTLTQVSAMWFTTALAITYELCSWDPWFDLGQTLVRRLSRTVYMNGME